MSQEVACLSESEILNYLAGRIESENADALDEHLRGCGDCVMVVCQLAEQVGSSNANLSTLLRPRVLLPDSLVAGRYLIRRVLGVGGMGEVHEALDQWLGKTVALKTLNAGLFGDERALARLTSEVAIAHRVTHPNVCRTFDLGVDRSTVPGAPPILFLTMEYIEGQTLAFHLRQHGTLSTSDARRLLTQLASGLAAAHASGVVHRDLKTENVMLVTQSSAPPRAVITDFGLAGPITTQVERSRERRRFSGTLAYAAPERLAGRAATPASDVYSLGLIALDMLTTTMGGAFSRALATQECGGSVARQRARAAGVVDLDPAWERLIARMIHPVPGLRLADGQAVLAALQHDLTVPPTGTVTRWSRRPKRWGLVVMTAAVVVAAVAASRPSRTVRSSHPPGNAPAVANGRSVGLPLPQTVTISARPAVGRRWSGPSSPSSLLTRDGDAARPRPRNRVASRTEFVLGIGGVAGTDNEVSPHSTAAEPSGDDDIVRELPEFVEGTSSSSPTVSRELANPFAGLEQESQRTPP
jgi:hypothetical protein